MQNKKVKFFLIYIFPLLRIIFYFTLFIFFSTISFNQVTSTSLCAMYEKTGIICSTCGVTRSFTLIMHGNFTEAFRYNQIFVLAIFPIFTFLFIDDTYNYMRRIIKKDFKPSLLEYIITGVIL